MLKKIAETNHLMICNIKSQHFITQYNKYLKTKCEMRLEHKLIFIQKKKITNKNDKNIKIQPG